MTTNEDGGGPVARQNATAGSGGRIQQQIAVAKEHIFAESREQLPAAEQLLRLALNEAEALAWQTAFPQLLFPVLATEKVQAVATWNVTQQNVRRASPIFVLAE